MLNIYHNLQMECLSYQNSTNNKRYTTYYRMGLSKSIYNVLVYILIN